MRMAPCSAVLPVRFPSHIPITASPPRHAATQRKPIALASYKREGAVRQRSNHHPFVCRIASHALRHPAPNFGSTRVGAVATLPSPSGTCRCPTGHYSQYFCSCKLVASYRINRRCRAGPSVQFITSLSDPEPMHWPSGRSQASSGPSRPAGVQAAEVPAATSDPIAADTGTRRSAPFLKVTSTQALVPRART